jgi:hypothetical protein
MKSSMIAILVACLVLGLTSCFDPEPGEVSLVSVKNGKPAVCAVQVFNNQGNQIQQESSNFDGVVYISDLKPGTYTLKFMDNHKNMYPAVRVVKVRADDSVWLGNVELTEGPAEVTEE